MVDKKQKLIRIVFLFLALTIPIFCGFIFQKLGITFFQNIPQRLGPMAHFNEQIRSNERDFDIVFFGSSAAWSAIDVQELKGQFKLQTGKDLRILNLSTNWVFENMLYESAIDFLKNRHVKLAVVELSMWENPDQLEHPATMYFINLFNMWPVLKNLNLSHKFRFYGNAVIAWPRQLLGVLLPNSRYGLTESQQKVHNHYHKNLGSFAKEQSWLANDDTDEKHRVTFKDFTPAAPKIEISKMLHTGGPRDPRKSSESYAMTHFQELMLREIFLTVEAQGGKMIFTDPVNDFNIRPYWRSRTYSESLFNNQMIPLIRVSNSDLLPGLSSEDLKQMYVDNQHRNKNGAKYFTKATFPAFANAYQNAIDGK